MTQKLINLGTADQGNGDPLRVAFSKVNDNFTELYTALGLDTPPLNIGAFEFSGSTISTSDSTPIIIDQAVSITSDLTVGGDILPNTNLGGNLGSPVRQWKSLYVSGQTIFLNNVPLSIDNGGTLLVDDEPIGTTISYTDIPEAPRDISDLTDTGGLLNENLEIDGGNAFTVYTAELEIDGGGA